MGSRATLDSRLHPPQQTPRQRLATQTCHQHPHGPLAYGIRLQGGERTRLAVDAIRSETARLRAGGEEESALGVQAEGAGYRFGRHVPYGRQTPGGGVYGEARDAVVASVGSKPLTDLLRLRSGTPHTRRRRARASVSCHISPGRRAPNCWKNSC